MDTAIEELVTEVGVSRSRACDLVGRSRASHYRARNPRPVPGPRRAPKPQPRALSDAALATAVEPPDHRGVAGEVCHSA